MCFVSLCSITAISGPDHEPHQYDEDDKALPATVFEETRSTPPPAPLPTSGAELAAMMKIGTRVVRGQDWKWGDQVRDIIYLTPLGTLKILLESLPVQGDMRPFYGKISYLKICPFKKRYLKGA